MYQIIGKQCGTVSFQSRAGTITSESLTRSSKMTSNAIEGGGSIEDHVYLNPEQMQISGIVVKQSEQFKDALERMWKTRDLVSYMGRVKLADCIITNLNIKTNSDNKYGFTFTATLQKAKIVTGQYVEMGEVKLMTQQDQASAPAATAAAAKTSAQSKSTTPTKSAGLKTTVSKSVSQSSYSAYVDSYNGGSSSGPTQRTTKSFNGV